MITPKQRAYLKSLAHNLNPAFQIGKNSITPEFTKAVNDYLEANEIIKISILNSCETPVKELSEIISVRTQSDVVQIIGKKLVLYRKSRTKPVIVLP